jgi:hypothetical protein
VSQLRKYIPDPSHVIQSDDVQVRENLTVKPVPLQIEDREVKHLKNKEITSVKVIWREPAGENTMWELESRMKESYPKLFPSGHFRGRKFFKWWRVVTPQLLEIFILIRV